MHPLETIALYGAPENAKDGKRKKKRPRWRGPNSDWSRRSKALLSRGAKETRNEKCFDYARNMRRKPTAGEYAFMKILKKFKMRLKFKKQVVMFGYILDFYAPRRYLAVEIDGPSHDKTKEYDQKRTNVLQSHGISMLRFTNEEVRDDPSRVGKIVSRLIKIKRQAPVDCRVRVYTEKELEVFSCERN